MSLGHTNIPYLDRLWHATTGCSAGCPDCWARSLVCGRLAGTMRGLPADDPFRPTFHVDRLADPLRMRKPSVIGVSFLGDLSDPAITDEQFAAVFGVVAACPDSTFVVLTKQARRLREWGEWLDDAAVRSTEVFPADDLDWRRGHVLSAAATRYGVPAGYHGRRGVTACPAKPWPIPGVWLGVSVTCQADADARIPDLLVCPAAHRWVSLEPMRGPVDLTRWLVSERYQCPGCEWDTEVDPNSIPYADCPGHDSEVLDAVILGGLHAPGAEPLPLEWVRSVRDQCAAAGVPFAYKQDSGPRPEKWPLLDGVRHRDVPWMRLEERQ